MWVSRKTGYSGQLDQSGQSTIYNAPDTDPFIWSIGMSVESDFAGIPNDGSTRPLTVPPEYDGARIKVGSLRQLVVPAEDLGLDAGGEDLDFSAQMLATIGKLNRQWWFALIQMEMSAKY